MTKLFTSWPLLSFSKHQSDCVDFLAIGGTVITSQDGISYMYMYNAFTKSSYLGHC